MCAYYRWHRANPTPEARHPEPELVTTIKQDLTWIADDRYWDGVG
jgi:hypothetical protein